MSNSLKNIHEPSLDEIVEWTWEEFKKMETMHNRSEYGDYQMSILKATHKILLDRKKAEDNASKLIKCTNCGAKADPMQDECNECRHELLTKDTTPII